MFAFEGRQEHASLGSRKYRLATFGSTPMREFWHESKNQMNDFVRSLTIWILNSDIKNLRFLKF
jgi:hypothetical protein